MKTVLLLDDDEDLSSLLKAALVSRGLEVIEAGNACDADEALQRRSVDLVIVDGLLPDVPGLEFIEHLRKRDPRIRVVFVSAFFRDLKTFKRLTAELDVSLVLYKPIEPTSFAEKVASVLEPATCERSAQGQPAPSEPSPLALELAELRRAFGKKLPERVEELRRAIQEVKQDLSALDKARMLAHRLRGSAGSYGYATVGELVGLVEDLLVDAQEMSPPRRFFWEDVESALRDASKAAARAPSFVRDGSSAAVGAERSLLVVDDDPDFLQMVRALGRRLLVDVITAHSAEEGIQRAESQPLVAAILDVHLDGSDSFLAARRIRETSGNGEIPIAFASVDGTIETRVAAIEAGGTRFFDKPISEEGFAELLQQFITISRQRAPRVLVVDDDADVVDQYTRHLRAAGFATEHLSAADDLVVKLEELRPDVLLLDVYLPRVSGIDICRALRSSDQWEFLPILIVTAQLDADTRLRAFRAGASDVVGKPILPEELLARVGIQEERMRLLRDRADRDSLSGLMLRRAFVESFQRALSACSREKRPLSLVLFDLDHFKEINDKHGHLAGARVIAALGELLRRRFRVEDLRARWGGEEFVLAFPGQGVDFAVRSAGRLLAEFAEQQFKTVEGGTFGATFTAGVAGYPDDGASMSALIRRADELLYAGKCAGRNMVQGSVPPAPSTQDPDPAG